MPSLDGERNGNLQRLLADLAGQTLTDIELLVVQGVRPNGRARNVGAVRARGRYLVFIDDDVRLGHRDVLANLVHALVDDPSLGLVGPSQLPPPDASRFQRAVARQLPRMRFPVVDRTTDTDMVTHMCLAVAAQLWRQVGGEHDDLVRGTDPDLRERVRAAGRRVAVVPDSWAYHPPPASLPSLIRSAWCGGRGAAWVRRHHPELAFDVPEGPFVGRAPVRRPAYRLARLGARLLLAALRGRFLLLVSDLAYAAGYASLRLARNEPAPEQLA
ncbi:glycosyltransferase [Gaiella occulta]|uniref:glycosyltransferase n=1 Tax=Gaiella occulta TaxID=1002870 RepID=UPI0030EBC03F